MANIRSMTHNELIDALGGTFAAAKLCRINPASVSGWRKANRIPPDKLVKLAVVLESRGIVKRKDLFQFDWMEIWPELSQQR